MKNSDGSNHDWEKHALFLIAYCADQSLLGSIQ